MTRLVTSRAALERALEDPALTVLLIAGSDGTPLAVHDLADGTETPARPWRVAFLVTDLALLTAAEKRDWELADGRYAVLGGDPPKALADSGDAADLTRTSGEPSILRVRQAFANGDQQ